MRTGSEEKERKIERKEKKGLIWNSAVVSGLRRLRIRARAQVSDMSINNYAPDR
jgi:hypothetical protein